MTDPLVVNNSSQCLWFFRGILSLHAIHLETTQKGKPPEAGEVLLINSSLRVLQGYSFKF